MNQTRDKTRVWSLIICIKRWPSKYIVLFNYRNQKGGKKRKKNKMKISSQTPRTNGPISTFKWFPIRPPSNSKSLENNFDGESLRQSKHKFTVQHFLKLKYKFIYILDTNWASTLLHHRSNSGTAPEWSKGLDCSCP